MPTRTNRPRCATCRGTGTTHRDGELLACSCPAGLEVNLGDLASLDHDLELQLARQNIVGDRVGSRSTDTLLPFDGTAARIRRGLQRMLAGWVSELAPGSEVLPSASVPALAAWLLRQFPALAHYPAVDELGADVAKHVAKAKRVIDRPADRIYLGPCETPDCLDQWSRRRTQLYALPDEQTVSCPSCFAEYDIDDRRAHLLKAAADRLASATECARALTSLGEPCTPERIRQWASRGRLVAHGLDPEKHPLYRIADVQELLAAAQLRRTG